MMTDYGLLRGVILDFLRIYPDYQLNLESDNSWDPILGKHGFSLHEVDRGLMKQIFHELAFEGVLLPGDRHAYIRSDPMCWPTTM
jgi:hypothetical protein